MRFQLASGAFRRPPAEPTLREPFLGYPKALTVVDEDGDAGAAPAAKNEEAARERVVGELALAQVGQGVDALAPVDGFYRHEHPHLRRDLQHYWLNSRTTVEMLVAGTPRISIRSFAPVADSTIIVHSAIVAATGASSSRNVALVVST